ncbi:MAG: hypothetical protein JWQ41_970 [Variovorax sp.]|nr:hypothetical protein [Variovorax sp.]
MPTESLRIEKLARRRVKSKLGWYTHAAIYLIVNSVLLAISLGTGRHWALYPLLGWGVGLLFHGIAVFMLTPDNRIVELMVERELAKLRPGSAPLTPKSDPESSP